MPCSAPQSPLPRPPWGLRRRAVGRRLGRLHATGSWARATISPSGGVRRRSSPRASRGPADAATSPSRRRACGRSARRASPAGRELRPPAERGRRGARRPGLGRAWACTPGAHQTASTVEHAVVAVHARLVGEDQPRHFLSYRRHAGAVLSAATAQVLQSRVLRSNEGRR